MHCHELVFEIMFSVRACSAGADASAGSGAGRSRSSPRVDDTETPTFRTQAPYPLADGNYWNVNHRSRNRCKQKRKVS